MKVGTLGVCFAGLLTLTTSLGAETGAPAGAAQKHFRSGLWHQWIVWIRPGTVATTALNRALTRINTDRGSKQAPPLQLESQPVLIFSAIEEADPRGPDGAGLLDGNREMFFATFVQGDHGSQVVLFLTDVLRSNSALTASGVPGKPARIVSSNLDVRSDSPGVKAGWTCDSDRDHIEFNADYDSAAVTERRSFPPAPDYLASSLAHSIDVIYPTQPTQIIGLWERSGSAWISLPNAHAKVKLKMKHHDPDIQAMFDDPQNLPMQLVEMARQVRFER